MFEVGFTELLLIFALALVVLGPEKLPRVASQVGRWIGRARAMARQFREQLEEEVNLEASVNRPQRPAAARPSTPATGATTSSSPSPQPDPSPAAEEAMPGPDPAAVIDPYGTRHAASDAAARTAGETSPPAQDEVTSDVAPAAGPRPAVADTTASNSPDERGT